MAKQAPEQDAPTTIEAQQAEARGRRQEDGSVVVPLVTDAGTADITIPPPPLWYEGAVEHLTAGRISEWVRLAVEDADSLVRWDSLRKRYRDLEAFVAAWSRSTGESPGESSGSSES